MTEPKDLEFLAEKSKEFIDKQINSYRHKHSNAGSVIAIIALFIPFFLNGLTDSYLCLKILIIVPVGLFLYSVKLLLDVLKTKSLDQGFHPDTFDELVNYMDYEKVLLYEIGANRSSFKDNEIITEQANKKFNLGIRITLIAVVISITILLINSFIKPPKEDKPQKVEIVNLKNMANETQNTNSQDSSTSGTNNTSGTSSAEPTRVIPIVPPTGRINLNETIVDMQTKVDTGKKGE